MRKRIMFLAFIFLLCSDHIAYSQDASDVFRNNRNVEVETIFSDAIEQRTFIHFTCDDDINRIRTSLDGGNPYVLLGEKEVQMFTDFYALVGEHSIGSVAFVTSLLSSGVRCIKYDILENAREAMILRLQDVADEKKTQKVKEQLMTLQEEYVYAAMAVDVPGVGPQVKTFFVCGGEKNECVVDSRFPATNVIAAQLRPPQKFVLKGKLFAKTIKTRTITPLPESLRFVANAQTSITTTGACPPDDLETNAAEVAKIHFVGDFVLGDLNDSDVAKGMKIVFNARPLTGVYVKVTLQGEASPSPDSRLVVREFFFRTSGSGSTTTLTSEAEGGGSFSVNTVRNLPNDIIIDYTGDLKNTVLTYKVIAENVQCIIVNQRAV